MKKIAHLAFVLPLLLVSCQAADATDKALNEALKKGLLASPALTNVPLEITETAIPWDATSSDASGRFSVKAKTTEGFYKAVDHAAGLQKLEITDLHENELNAAISKIDTLPMSYRTNLRNALAAEQLNLPRFYDVFVPKGGEVTIRGSVKMVKFRNDDWQIEELQVNPLLVGNAPLGNDYTPESKLQATEYRLDDPKTKEAVNAVIQNRKNFVARVESAGGEWKKEQEELNVILKKALDGRNDFVNLPMEITEVTGNWTDKSSGDASGTFAVKAKALEGLYKSVDTAAGLRMLGITDLYEREFSEARDKVMNVRSRQALPPSHPGNLRSTMPQDRLDWQFYEILVPQGREINITGAVKLVKYGNDDWEVEEIHVNPLNLAADGLIPASQLREGYRLDDPQVKETVSAVIQQRREFVDRVNEAFAVWTEQQQREAAEAERIARERRKVEINELKKSAIVWNNEYFQARGFRGTNDSARTFVYGTAILQEELRACA